jgi:hypothetical protein
MMTVLKGHAIAGVVFSGLVFACICEAQDADDPSQLRGDIERGEDEALSAVGQDLGDLKNNSEKALKNEFERDVALVEGGVSAASPSMTFKIIGTRTPDDSLKEIGSEVDSLEAQSKDLSR